MRAFQPFANSFRLDVTTSSGSVRVLTNSAANVYRIANNGPNEAYVAISGTAEPTAAIPSSGASGNCLLIPANSVDYIVGPTNAWFAGISAATETAQLWITPGSCL